VALADWVSVTASDEAYFDHSKAPVRTSLQTLSTKPNDLAVLNVAKWRDHFSSNFSQFMNAESSLLKSYAQLFYDIKSDGSNACAMYTMQLDGTDKKHGLPHTLDELNALRTSLGAVLGQLRGAEHYFESRLLQGHLSGRNNALLTAKIKSIRDTIDVLQRNIDSLQLSIANGAAEIVYARSNLQSHKCPGYVPVTKTPTPTPTPKATPTPKPTSAPTTAPKSTPTPKSTPMSKLTPTPAWTKCPLYVPAYRCCPQGQKFDTPSGKCVQAMLRRSPRTSMIVARSEVYFSGSARVNVLPSSSFETTSSRPPWTSTILRAM
jgi:hypothetical protein